MTMTPVGFEKLVVKMPTIPMLAKLSLRRAEVVAATVVVTVEFPLSAFAVDVVVALYAAPAIVLLGLALYMLLMPALTFASASAALPAPVLSESRECCKSEYCQ